MALEVRAVLAPYQFTRREIRQIWWAGVVGVVILFTLVAGFIARHNGAAGEETPGVSLKPAP